MGGDSCKRMKHRSGKQLESVVRRASCVVRNLNPLASCQLPITNYQLPLITIQIFLPSANSLGRKYRFSNNTDAPAIQGGTMTAPKIPRT
jgi:hypothetical protein